MFKRKVTHVFNFSFFTEREVEVFEVPLSMIGISQWILKVIRLNKLLPIGHRMRGDIGSEKICA